MNGLPYYKAYPRDFIEGTIGMPFELKCAYRVVLDLIYMQGGKLPDDARYISGLLGCSIRKWKSLRSSLISADKIQVNGEFLSNYRADNELETLAKQQEKQAENARRPRKNNNLQKPRLSHTEPEPEPDSPTANADREGEKPPDYSKSFETFWSGYPLTEGVSRRKAEAEWQALSPDERAVAIATLPRFAVIQAKRDAPFCPAPAKWLAERRFETVLSERPQSVKPLRPVELTDSAEHKFLAECRADKAFGWEQWTGGGFQIHEFNGQTVCVVSRRIDEFCAAFRPTAKRLGYLIWPDAFYQKQLEKAAA